MLRQCLFCEAVLLPTTRPEHILLDALGGRFALRTLDCTGCNNRFGSTIDKALTDQVGELRNLMRLPSGSGRPAPSIRGVPTGGTKINVHGDGRLELADKPFAVQRLENGAWNLRINARSEEHIRRLMPHIAAAIGTTEERLVEQLEGASFSLISKRPDMATRPMSFGGPDAIRSMVKSALCLWAVRVGNAEVRSASFAVSRRFVTDGGDEFALKRTELDSRELPGADRLEAAYGQLFNLIYVRSDARGRVVGHFTLYNMLAWQLVLAESGATPNQKIALISNPLDSTKWSKEAAAEFDVGMDWLDWPDFSDEMARTKDRMGTAMQHHYSVAMPQAIGDIIDASIEWFGYKPDQQLTPEEAWSLSGYIAQRVTSHVMGMPFEEKLTGADLLRVMKGESAVPGGGQPASSRPPPR